MSIEVRLADETATGQLVREFLLQFASERISARELIRSRVLAEVAKFNAKSNETLFHGLVAPTDAEQELNGYRLRKSRKLDPEVQAKKAVESFSSGGFLLLVDEQQVDDLNDELQLHAHSKVSFVKLVQLVGG